jgi:TPR repeat protein
MASSHDDFDVFTKLDQGGNGSSEAKETGGSTSTLTWVAGAAVALGAVAAGAYFLSGGLAEDDEEEATHKVRGKGKAGLRKGYLDKDEDKGSPKKESAGAKGSSAKGAAAAKSPSSSKAGSSEGHLGYTEMSAADLKKLVDADTDPDAICEFGRRMLFPPDAAPDLPEARRKFLESARRGSFKGMAYLSVMGSRGSGGDKNERVSCSRDAPPCTRARPDAAKPVLLCFFCALPSPQTPLTQPHLARLLATVSLSLLSPCPSLRRVRNSQEAKEWAVKSQKGLKDQGAEGDAEAFNALGRLYFYEILNGKKTETHVKACKGDQKAAQELANHKVAIKFFYESAILGYVKGQHNMGLCYDLGTGCEQNPKEAAKYYKMAAEQGDVQSMKWLGLKYLGGKDGSSAVPQSATQNPANAKIWPKNYALAHKYMKMAADAGTS